jgi:hypothetical protein
MANSNLYLVKSRGFRAYVVAEDTEQAWSKFSNWLIVHDYGFYCDRDFDSVEIVARESGTPKTKSGCSFDDTRKDDMLFL